MWGICQREAYSQALAGPGDFHRRAGQRGAHDQ